MHRQQFSLSQLQQGLLAQDSTQACRYVALAAARTWVQHVSVSLLLFAQESTQVGWYVALAEVRTAVHLQRSGVALSPDVAAAIGRPRKGTSLMLYRCTGITLPDRTAGRLSNFPVLGLRDCFRVERGRTNCPLDVPLYQCHAARVYLLGLKSPCFMVKRCQATSPLTRTAVLASRCRTVAHVRCKSHSSGVKRCKTKSTLAL